MCSHGFYIQHLTPPSLLKFRQLLPDEDPKVTDEKATYFASTMVEFQAKI